MWSLALLAFLAGTCVDLGVAYSPYYGGGMGGMGGMSLYDPYSSFGGSSSFGGGFMGGSSPSYLDDRSQGEPELLNCYARYLTDDGRSVTNEIAVTIEQRHDSGSDWDQGFGMGMGYGGMGYGGMGYGGGYGGMGHGGMGMHSNDRGSSSGPGLSARVELISNVDGGKGYIVFTRTARSEDGCFRESFGDVLMSRDNMDDRQGQQGMGGYGMGGYGGMMGYGMDLGMVGYGMGFGMGHGHGSMFEQNEGEGIISEINVTPGALTSAVIENIGFSDLSQLAGRGVVICSNVNYDWDWNPSCDEPYYSCCSLKYDNVGITLTDSLP